MADPKSFFELVLGVTAFWITVMEIMTRLDEVSNEARSAEIIEFRPKKSKTR